MCWAATKKFSTDVYKFHVHIYNVCLQHSQKNSFYYNCYEKGKCSQHGAMVEIKNNKLTCTCHSSFQLMPILKPAKEESRCHDVASLVVKNGRFIHETFQYFIYLWEHASFSFIEDVMWRMVLCLQRYKPFTIFQALSCLFGTLSFSPPFIAVFIEISIKYSIYIESFVLPK